MPKQNIDHLVRRYRMGAYGGIIATIPIGKAVEAKKTFGSGFPTKGTLRDGGKEADFHFKTNSKGHEKLSNLIKDQKKWQW
jgi:hypothetical protein